MFNMQKIGKKISSLRKENGMTQMELADKLGISFQAVSNWERGNSMPDISKLPELAEIFQVSLDELLGEKSVLVEAAIHDNIAECIEKNQITEEEVGNALPILKPDQVNIIMETAEPGRFKDISMFIPFMDESDVREFAMKTLEEGGNIEEYLPFMDEDNVKGFAYKVEEKGKSILGYLPFMDESDVREFAMKTLEEGGNIEEYLPFMDEDDVKDLAFKALELGKAIDIFLPFMDERDVKELAIRYFK